MNAPTERTKRMLAYAGEEALRVRNNHIGTEHLLLGLIKLGEGVAINVLQKMGANLDTLREMVEQQLAPNIFENPATTLPQSPRVRKVFGFADREAKDLGHSYLGTEHLLLGILREGEGVAANVLKNLGIELDKCRDEIRVELGMNLAEDSDMEENTEPASVTADEPKNSAKNERTPALKAFGRDLTELARNGEIDPVVGRENEIRRVVQILARRTKNNPILIGEAGVGKTAIVEGLAQQIASGVIPEILQNKKVITLDLTLLVAGTKYRGQFEERIKTVMDEIRKSKNIILFIDELHTIIGAGGAEGSMDASNIFKPALSRGTLQCIGATTLSEYRKYIEKDTALERRFQPVTVNDPSIEDSIKILNGIKKKYEEHHGCHYTDAAVEAAVRLSDRYITARHLPDKAIDVLDEAGARARIGAFQRPPEIEDLQTQIDAVCVKKEEAAKNQNFEDAARCRDKEKTLRKTREEKIEEWKKSCENHNISVDEEDMFKIVADWTGVPLSRMEKKESQKLLDLEKDLQEIVIGQHRACEVIARALRRARADLKDPRRPNGTFLFLGPTGVGKTMLAKTLAEGLFGNQDALIQFDMSEYMEKFTVSRLIGSPPGYVGYEEGGQLTEAVRRKPYSIVLFDEIEKAHPDVVQLLLQVLEDGRLTDSLGRTVDFRNTIIIMTSNAGADILQRNASMGFDVGVSADRDFEKIKEKILDEAKRVFKPEFLNRISELVIFAPLNKTQLMKIVDLEIAKVAKRLAAQQIKISVNDTARNFLVENGYDEKYGARQLRRSVERNLEDPLAEAILREEILKDGAPVLVGANDTALTFEQTKNPEKVEA